MLIYHIFIIFQDPVSKKQENIFKFFVTMPGKSHRIEKMHPLRHDKPPGTWSEGYIHIL